MIRFYKRLINFICLTLAFSLLFLCACLPNKFEQGQQNLSQNENNSTSQNKNELDKSSLFSLTVTFIDVGDGECILIEFPDGKTMLIDSGDFGNSIANKILKLLDSKNISKIDYFLITHTDVDHLGSAYSIIERVQVGKIFLPKIHKANLIYYPPFSSLLNSITEKQIPTEISKMLCGFSCNEQGKDYMVAFLSPRCADDDDTWFDNLSPYTYLMASPNDPILRNDVSPILYLEYMGVRFLFTGDVSHSQELFILDHYNVGFYDNVFPKKIDLSNIDFLKVAHHGANDTSSNMFLTALQPKNAVICSGVDRGHPHTEVLLRILSANEQCNIYQTNTYGNVSVKVWQNKIVEVHKQYSV